MAFAAAAAATAFVAPQPPQPPQPPPSASPAATTTTTTRGRLTIKDYEDLVRSRRFSIIAASRLSSQQPRQQRRKRPHVSTTSSSPPLSQSKYVRVAGRYAEADDDDEDDDDDENGDGGEENTHLERGAMKDPSLRWPREQHQQLVHVPSHTPVEIDGERRFKSWKALLWGDDLSYIHHKVSEKLGALPLDEHGCARLSFADEEDLAHWAWSVESVCGYLS